MKNVCLTSKDHNGETGTKDMRHKKTVKERKNIYHGNGNLKRAGVAILLIVILLLCHYVTFFKTMYKSFNRK